MPQPRRYYSGECDCGREIARSLPKTAEGGNTDGIHFRCPECDSTTFLRPAKQREVLDN